MTLLPLYNDLNTVLEMKKADNVPQTLPLSVYELCLTPTQMSNEEW